jgi:TonB family protein
VRVNTRLFCFSACAALLLCAAAVCCAQTAAVTPSTTQLTAEQKTLLDGAVQLSREVQHLNKERKFDQALPLAHRVVEVRRRILGEDDRLVADAISDLGDLYIGKEDYERAEAQFRKALSIYEKAGSPTGNMAYTIDALTLLRWSARDYNKAEDYGKRALALKAQLYGEPSVQFFTSIDSLLRVYHSAGKTSQRNALYARALSVAEKAKDRIPDRPALFRYHCGLRDGKQTAEVVAMLRQIEALLSWNPSAQAPLAEGVLNGRALILVRPEYPPEARAAKATGRVVVQIMIDECGKVVSAKATSGNALLRAVSESAARAAKFSPTFISGMPIAVTGIIEYRFLNSPP